MALPRPRVSNKYRLEEVNLQPYGNTVSVEAPSDNPFESDQDVEIYTQASGGMAGPDRRMRSRGVMVKRPQNTRHQGGKVRTFKVRMDAAHAGFMPGLGALNKSKHSFMPGLSADTPFAQSSPRSPAPQPNPWLTGANELVKAGTGIIDQRTASANARAADAQARAEQSRADQARSDTMRMSILSNMGKRSAISLPLIATAVAAIGIAIYLKTKKK